MNAGNSYVVRLAVASYALNSSKVQAGITASKQALYAHTFEEKGNLEIVLEKMVLN